MTWKRVDLPEPVLPASSACWRVPLPMARYCNLVAPVRPMGTRNSVVVSRLHSSGSAGAICENGTSTRFESRLQRPTLLMNWMAKSGSGGASSRRVMPGMNFPVRVKSLPLQVTPTLLFLNSSGTKSCGSGCRRSQWMSVKTPQRAPLAAMLSRRRAAASLKFTGKSATTTKWYFSAILPACSLYSAMVAYSLRRYIWMTFSMCSFNSASRCSIWPVCVQMRLVMTCSA